MGTLTVKIDDEIEKEFRKLILDIKGSKKGALAEAVEEAIKLWIEKYKKSERKL